LSGRGEHAWAAISTLIQIVDPARDAFNASFTLAVTAVIAATGADPAPAADLVAHAERLAAPLHNPALDAVVAWATGIVERSEEHYESAADHFAQALTLAERSRNVHIERLVPFSQALLAVMTDVHDADRTLVDAVGRLYKHRDWFITWGAVEALALCWTRIGRREDAAVLLGHLQSQDISHGAFVEQRRQALEILADTPDVHRWMSRGARLDRDELIRYVFETQATDQAILTIET
jgi:hypothetical protein